MKGGWWLSRWFPAKRTSRDLVFELYGLAMVVFALGVVLVVRFSPDFPMQIRILWSGAGPIVLGMMVTLHVLEVGVERGWRQLVLPSFAAGAAVMLASWLVTFVLVWPLL